MPNDWTIRMQYQGETETIPDFGSDNFIVNAQGAFEAQDAGC